MSQIEDIVLGWRFLGSAIQELRRSPSDLEQQFGLSFHESRQVAGIGQEWLGDVQAV